MKRWSFGEFWSDGVVIGWCGEFGVLVGFVVDGCKCILWVVNT